MAGGTSSHLLYELPGYDNTVQEVLARIRVLSFESGDDSHGGVAVGVDPATGMGMNYLFQNDKSEVESGNYFALLDDLAGWGPGQGLAWQAGQWYWLRLRQTQCRVAGRGRRRLCQGLARRGRHGGTARVAV